MVTMTDEDKGNAHIGYLKTLVTVLTVTMIMGVIVMIWLFVTRLPPAPAPMPASITLPDGASATAFTRGPDWFAIVTDDERILILDQHGTLRQTITLADP